MNARKALTWIGIAFVTFFVLSSPKDAGSTVRSGMDGIGRAGNQIVAFVNSI